MRRVGYSMVFLTGLVTAMAGCHGGKAASENEEVASAGTVTPTSTLKTKESPPKSPGDGQLDPAPPQAGGPDQFKPPFPAKLDVFAPPRVEQAVPTTPEVSHESEQVRLIGFVEFEEQKALLSFRGRIRSMTVGDVFEDVEVVSIEPPKVVLQRGRKRWATALFNQPMIHRTVTRGPIFGGGGPQVSIGSSSSNSRAGSPSASRQEPANPTDFPSPNRNLGQPELPGDDGLPALPELPGEGDELGGFENLPDPSGVGVPEPPPLP